MYSPRTAPTGSVVLTVGAPTPTTLLLRVDDATGRPVLRRRLHDRRTTLRLPAGRLRLTLADERVAHDPARLAPASLEVDVAAGETVAATARPARGAVLRLTTARWARVSAVHADGERVEARADGRGEVVLAGLRAGTWTLVGHDPRRSRCSAATVLEISAGSDTTADLPTDLPTGRLLVSVRGGDRRPVLVDRVQVVDPTGRTVTAPLRDGLADVRDLRPGPLRVVVPASVGHLGGEVAVELAPGALGHVEAVSAVGASVTGRVVQHAHAHADQYAAVVALLDPDGAELERVRTDDHGRFALGTGLRSVAGLTVVATTGPETLHVTRAAVADVDVVTGVRHHLGDVVLPVAGRAAVWRARTPAVDGMRLPSTRV